MVRTCVTWDVLLVLLNPPQDLTSCRAGARPGHPISGLAHRSKPQSARLKAQGPRTFATTSSERDDGFCKMTPKRQLGQHRFHRMDIHAPRCLNMGAISHGGTIMKKLSMLGI